MMSVVRTAILAKNQRSSTTTCKSVTTTHTFTMSSKRDRWITWWMSLITTQNTFGKASTCIINRSSSWWALAICSCRVHSYLNTSKIFTLSHIIMAREIFATMTSTVNSKLSSIKQLSRQGLSISHKWTCRVEAQQIVLKTQSHLLLSNETTIKLLLH